MKEIILEDLDTSDRILRAADRLFLAQGFGATSTVQIAREAGCNQALVHYYYRSKELLFQAVFESKLRIFSDVFFAIDNLGGTFLERLERRIEAHFDLLVVNPLLPRLIVTEIANNPERLIEMRGRLGHLSAEMLATLDCDLRRAIGNGEIREISVLDLFINIVALNAAIFLVLPSVNEMMKMSKKQVGEFMEHRKKENVKTILNSLRV